MLAKWALTANWANEEFTSLMVEKGVLAFTADRRYTVAIPSMSEWLGRTYGGGQGTASSDREDPA